LLCLLLIPVLCAAQSAEETARKLEARLQGLKSLQGDFEQLYFSAAISKPMQESGRFIFAAPALMKWEYQKPEEKYFLLKDGGFQFYIPEDNQLIRGALDEQGYEGDILSLLSGRRSILDNYRIEPTDFPTSNRDVSQLKLTPNKEELEAYLLLEVSKKSGLIQRVIFFDWAGNKQEFRFHRLKANSRIPLKKFELEVPPDVEIIENRETAGRNHPPFPRPAKRPLYTTITWETERIPVGPDTLSGRLNGNVFMPSSSGLDTKTFFSCMRIKA